MYPSSSSRWCPTPEQLMILDEMYRGGIRTPKAVQIQAITAYLSHYGKIEAKNVFYWFQNHKARERQKLRRKLMMSKQNPNQNQEFKNQNEQIPHFFYYIPVEALPQGRIVNASSQIMAAASPKVEPSIPEHQRYEMDRAVGRTDRDWLVILDAGSTKNKPLKTLELFPTTPTGYDLKNECTTSSVSTN